MKQDTHFGRRIKQLRSGSGPIANWSQKRLAEHIGVSTSFIASLENGPPIPMDKDIIERLAEALNVSSAELLELAKMDSIEKNNKPAVSEELPQSSISSSDKVPTAFISYSWDSEDHRQWVRELAVRLRGDGIDITLDQWHAAPGDQLAEFMECAVSDNDFVLIICSPPYKDKSSERRGGVGYEGDIMTGEVFQRRNQRKFIPILRTGDWDEAAPSWIIGKYYIDLRGTPYNDNNYHDLLRTLHNKREQAPPIGQANFDPISLNISVPEGNSNSHTSTDVTNPKQPASHAANKNSKKNNIGTANHIDIVASNKQSRNFERVAACTFGVTFIIAIILIALLIPDPKPFQYLIFRIVISLAASGFIVVIPGAIEINISKLVRGSGAIAVFVLVYFYNPAFLGATKSNSSADKIVWEKNWHTISESFETYGGSNMPGVQITNREKLLSIVSSLDLSSTPDIKRECDLLKLDIKNGKHYDGGYYNLVYTAEMEQHFDNLKRAIRNKATDYGVQTSLNATE